MTTLKLGQCGLPTTALLPYYNFITAFKIFIFFSVRAKPPLPAFNDQEFPISAAKAI